MFVSDADVHEGAQHRISNTPECCPLEATPAKGFHIGTVAVRKVDVDVRILLLTSNSTWGPMVGAKFPDVRFYDVINFDVVTNVKTA